MMQSDSQVRVDADALIGNNDSVNLDMISEIEKELQHSPYDLTSLIFLLYDVPDTALQRLVVYQRISKDMGSCSNLDMLQEWFRYAKSTPTWKHTFVEALLICQLNGVVRKLGFNVSAARAYYQIDNLYAKMYINPMKKALYKLCENMNSDNLEKLKKSLLTFDIDTSDYDSGELIMLKLMCEKFININQFQYNKKVYGIQVHINKLLKIIEKLPGLKKMSIELNMLQISINDEASPNISVITSTPKEHLKVDESKQEQENKKMYPQDLSDVLAMFHDLDLSENADILKADGKNLPANKYEIKNTKRIGICAIINQEEFYPSRDSLKDQHQCNMLEPRVGSTKDRIVLEKTMKSLNFEVITKTNLDHKQMFHFIDDVTKNKICSDDSMFILCILSHGVRGHVVAADSVKVNMDKIQNLLDSDDAIFLRDIPKLIIVQACQIEDVPHPTLMADSPSNSYKLKKANFLICWATAPELEAYRDAKSGSIFIQILCRTIKEYADKEHVSDIFTIVIDKVTKICEKLRIEQVPIVHSTLTQKLYLHNDS